MLKQPYLLVRLHEYTKKMVDKCGLVAGRNEVAGPIMQSAVAHRTHRDTRPSAGGGLTSLL